MAKVFVSSVIDASVPKVWQRVRDFNGMPGWHPAIADSFIEDGLRSDSVGCVRNFNLTGGGNLREQLVALSDEQHSFTYRILVAPMPVQNYVSTLTLHRVADTDRTYGEWTAEFDVPREKQDEMVALVESVFQAGFNSLQADLGRRSGA